ncbi:CDC16 protein [Naganishia albida]|nr:CDC16 protein [Naganishia albida]
MTDPSHRSAFLKILNQSSNPATSSEISDNLKRLRRLVLTRGIPEDSEDDQGIPIRARVWKLLLRIDHISAEDYLRWVDKGPSEMSAKIKNDTFRTLATDLSFKGKVREDMLIRLLEAFAWKNSQNPTPQEYSGLPPNSYSEKKEKGRLEFAYVQGMNVLSAPFLYSLPSEIEAFTCFSKFIETCCPLYVQPTLTGVHRGLELLDKCLQAVDVELYDHLRSKNLSAELYAFPSVLTLCACTPPLDQVLKLWDFLLAFGVHLNILCVIAQLLIMRDDLMVSSSPMKILRIFPPLQASNVISITVALVKDVPEDLYGELVKHPYCI